jgi:tetratricopeptide (TPR) repeat protein
MIRSYESALAAMRLGSGEALRLARCATEEAPRSADALALEASLLVYSRDPRDVEAAGWAYARLRRLPIELRHHEHARAIAAALDGDFERAGLYYDRLLLKEPQDTLALWAAQTVDYYLGAAPALAARAERVAQQFSPSQPGYHFVLASLAFGLQECGDYAAAEEHARRALELEPADLRARHALMHVFEMQGRAAEGLALAAGSNHLAWHHALFQLQLGRARKALELYDGALRHESLADLIDAAALLWRLSLAGADTGRRFGELAGRWAPYAEDAYCAFNDMHAMMAFAGAGRWDWSDRLLRAQERRIARASGANYDMTRLVGLPACRALAAYARGDHDTAETLLRSLPPVAHRIGGSHAQRDILFLTRARLQAPRQLAAA